MYLCVQEGNAILFAEAVAEAKAALTNNIDLSQPNPSSPIVPNKLEGEEQVDTYTGQMVFLTTQNTENDTGEDVKVDSGNKGMEKNDNSSNKTGV